MSDEETKPSEEDYTLDKLLSAYNSLRDMKPDRRCELGRRVAVAVTEIEKVIGYYYTFVIPEFRNPSDNLMSK